MLYKYVFTVLASRKLLVMGALVCRTAVCLPEVWSQQMSVKSSWCSLLAGTRTGTRDGNTRFPVRSPKHVSAGEVGGRAELVHKRWGHLCWEGQAAQGASLVWRGCTGKAHSVGRSSAEGASLSWEGFHRGRLAMLGGGSVGRSCIVGGTL